MIMATVNGPEDNSKLLSVSINPSPTRVRVHTAGGYRDQHMASDGRSSEYLAAAAAVHANLLASFDVHMLCGSSQTPAPELARSGLAAPDLLCGWARRMRFIWIANTDAAVVGLRSLNQCGN